MRLRTFDGGGDTVHDGRLATDIKDRFADSGVPPQSAGEKLYQNPDEMFGLCL